MIGEFPVIITASPVLCLGRVPFKTGRVSVWRDGPRIESWHCDHPRVKGQRPVMGCFGGVGSDDV